MTMENKIIKLTDDQYFDSAGLSNSFLNRFDRSPAHAFTEMKKTSAMNTGTLIHDYILQRDYFFNKYIIAPIECENRVKKPFPEFKKENPEKEIILYNDYIELQEIAKNINNYEILETDIKSIIESSQCEIACFYNNPDYNVLQKCKIDILFQSENYNLIIDLKTTDNCMDFYHSVKRYKYYRQYQYYSNIVKGLTGKTTHFLFLTVEKDKPFGVKVFDICDNYKDLGTIENQKSIENFIEWDKTKDLSKVYSNGIEIIYKGSY